MNVRDILRRLDKGFDSAAQNLATAKIAERLEQTTHPLDSRLTIEVASEGEREQARWEVFVRGKNTRPNVFRLGRWSL